MDARLTVVDASVAVKWLVSEKDEDAADDLLASGDRLLGPSLVRVEVAAAVARKARFEEITGREADLAIDLWLWTVSAGGLNLVPEDEDLPAAFKLSTQLKHPLQDCLYLALAERMDAALVTADAKFVAKAGGLYPRVQLLGYANRK